MRIIVYILLGITLLSCNHQQREKWISSADSLCITIQNQSHLMDAFPSDSLQFWTSRIAQKKILIRDLTDTATWPSLQRTLSPYFNMEKGMINLNDSHKEIESIYQQDLKRLMTFRNDLRQGANADAEGNEINDAYVEKIIGLEKAHLDSLQGQIQNQYEEGILILQQAHWLQPLIDSEIQKKQALKE